MSSIAWTFCVATAGLCALFLRRALHGERRAREVLAETRRSGLTEPASLHPVIDRHRCIGCGACVSACPEGDILALIDGKAELVQPTHCIGHGACRTACPAEAITLVFGTERRGVDIPHVEPDFETNVPGLFIAGELGGMGLIRNAIEQGRQAMDSIRRLDGMGDGSLLDVVVVGAGPAGFSASLRALEHGLRFRTLEQDTLGGTVAHFPRAKVVMTAPVELPLVGRVRFRETTKEALLGFWEEVERRNGLDVRYGERVVAVERNGQGFVVRSETASYHARAVLLAIGRRGTPRRLEVPGEDRRKVVYRLVDPEQYRGRRVLVVGGGDSALEAAAAVAEQPGTEVTLAHRAEAFDRAKLRNRQRVERLAHEGRLRVRLRTRVVEIGSGDVRLAGDGTPASLPNDDVIVCIGGTLPSRFLESIGVRVETKRGSV